QAEDGIRDLIVTGVQTCALPISAVVDCYGVGQRMPDLKPLRGIPVLGIFGGKDHSAAEFAALEKAAKENGVPFTKYTYPEADHADRKSTRLNSSHDQISYAVFCL